MTKLGRKEVEAAAPGHVANVRRLFIDRLTLDQLDAITVAADARTDAAGMVEFRTIYPGWYPGRTVHIHLIVQVDERVLTSQLYFPEPLNDDVLSLAPYAERPGRDTTNQSDTILPTGGTPAVLDIEAVGTGYRGGVCLLLPRPS